MDKLSFCFMVLLLFRDECDRLVAGVRLVRFRFSGLLRIDFKSLRNHGFWLNFKEQYANTIYADSLHNVFNSSNPSKMLQVLRKRTNLTVTRPFDLPRPRAYRALIGRLPSRGRDDHSFSWSQRFIGVFPRLDQGAAIHSRR